MSYLRGKAAALFVVLALIGLGTFAATTPAAPASALVFTQQCDPSNGCMNFWNGGYPIAAYYGTAANNNIAVQWVSSTEFELRDNLHGGCVGDNGGSKTNARAAGGQSCPSSGNAAWGSLFEAQYLCNGNYAGYHNVHWNANLDWGVSNGTPAYLNSGFHCIQQRS